jgi:hypothetical protein
MNFILKRNVFVNNLAFSFGRGIFTLATMQFAPSNVNLSTVMPSNKHQGWSNEQMLSSNVMDGGVCYYINRTI